MQEKPEVLPLAEKTYSLAKGTPNVADTLDWIHHLAGDDATPWDFPVTLSYPDSNILNSEFCILTSAFFIPPERLGASPPGPARPHDPTSVSGPAR